MLPWTGRTMDYEMDYSPDWTIENTERGGMRLVAERLVSRRNLRQQLFTTAAKQTKANTHTNQTIPEFANLERKKPGPSYLLLQALSSETGRFAGGGAGTAWRIRGREKSRVVRPRRPIPFRGPAIPRATSKGYEDVQEKPPQGVRT